MSADCTPLSGNKWYFLIASCNFSSNRAHLNTSFAFWLFAARVHIIATTLFTSSLVPLLSFECKTFRKSPAKWYNVQIDRKYNYKYLMLVISDDLMDEMQYFSIRAVQFGDCSIYCLKLILGATLVSQMLLIGLRSNQLMCTGILTRLARHFPMVSGVSLLLDVDDWCSLTNYSVTHQTSDMSHWKWLTIIRLHNYLKL